MKEKNSKKIVVYSLIGTMVSLTSVGSFILNGKFKKYEKEYNEKRKYKEIESQIKHNEIYGGIDLYFNNKGKEDIILDQNAENYQILKKVVDDNNLVLICNHFNGYLSVSSEGIIYFLDEFGYLYKDMDKYLENKSLENISTADLNRIIEITKKESFMIKDYVLLYEPSKNNIYQEIYKNGKHIGNAYYKKIDGENTIIFEDDNHIISASSFSEFTILYDNLPYLIMQKNNFEDYCK